MGITMNNIDLINADLSKANEAMNQPPQSVGMLTIKPANEWSEQAAQQPNPTPLWLSLWNEGECCVLFADTNLGKSILAVQIAEDIARNKNQKVLYFDFELTPKQFQMRYSEKLFDELRRYQFSPNFLRVEISPENMMCENFEEQIVNDVEQCANQSGAQILIIDNLSFLCSATEKGDLAGALMLRLVQMRKSKGLSILVLAHTPKRNLSNPITQNDLAGSKKLINFFDSAFAIGKSAKDSKLRYIKQLKCRNTEMEYDSDNVIVCTLEKKECFLQFKQIECATEAEHLKIWSVSELIEREAKAKELNKSGKSISAIAKELGISRTTAHRLIHKGEEKDSGKSKENPDEPQKENANE